MCSCSKIIFPESALIDFKINFAIVDFPEPDSPANTKTSPCFNENETSSTALTIEVSDVKIFFLMKYFFHFSIFNISVNVCRYFIQYIKKYVLCVIFVRRILS